MSLIIAEQTPDGPRIVSDTRVVLPDGERTSFKTGTLKAVTIAPHVTVCFAGDVVAGLTAIREFARRLEDGVAVNELLSRLQSATANARRQVEFIVTTGGADSRLTRIRNGDLETNLQVAWIGDDAAFERFQEARHAAMSRLDVALEEKLSPGTKTMMRLRRCMEAVIEDQAVPSVGDFCAAIAWKSTGFEYLGSVFVHVGRDVVIKPGEDVLSKMVRPVEEGGYSVSVVEPAEPGTPALGLTFPTARLGMLYLPLIFDGAKVFHDVSANDFSKAVFERFGVAMNPPLLRSR